MKYCAVKMPASLTKISGLSKTEALSIPVLEDDASVEWWIWTAEKMNIASKCNLLDQERYENNEKKLYRIRICFKNVRDDCFCFKYFIGDLRISYNTFWSYSLSPNSSQTHPLSFPHSSVFDCSARLSRSAAFHWSVGNSPGAVSLEKTHSPSSSSC